MLNVAERLHKALQDAEIVVDYDMMERHVRGQRPLPRPVMLVSQVVGTFAHLSRHVVLEAVCKQAGHQWEDHGYGGPEHGYIDQWCTRCGEQVYERLY